MLSYPSETVTEMVVGTMRRNLSTQKNQIENLL